MAITDPAIWKARDSVRYRLIIGKLPPGCLQVERDATRVRQALEDALLAKHGRVTLTQACLIQTAAKYQLTSSAAMRWLREAAGLSPTEKLFFVQQAAAASERRDKIIRMLNLDDAGDFQRQLYALVPMDDAEVQGTGESASEAKPGALPRALEGSTDDQACE